MNKSTVDIICLVHNQLHVTKAFVKHLFENTTDFRLIFVDNASTDDTPAYLEEGEKDGKWTVSRNKSNTGIVNARTEAAKLVTSNYFMNIDNDQYVQPGWLDSLFNLIDKGYDIVGPEAWLMLPPSSPGMIVTEQYKVHTRAYFPVKRATQPKDQYTYVGCGGMLIKKEVYDKIGLFDPEYNPAYFEDPDFNFRALKAGFKFAWDPNCKVTHLAHQTTNFQKNFNKNAQFMKSYFAFQRKWMPFYPGPFQTEV
jgi:GT2 family glycosyltransferase